MTAPVISPSPDDTGGKTFKAHIGQHLGHHEYWSEDAADGGQGGGIGKGDGNHLVGIDSHEHGRSLSWATARMDLPTVVFLKKNCWMASRMITQIRMKMY